LEKAFVTVAKRCDHHVPPGKAWHRELLQQMARPTKARQALISEALAKHLASYLRFRHFYRHAYSFRLDWQELQGLVVGLPHTWKDVRQALTAFMQGANNG
jgi:hypothetical protein